MTLKFAEDVVEGQPNPFPELEGVTEISREETHHEGGAVSVEFKFKDKNGAERYFFYNCMDYQDTPKTLEEVIRGMSQDGEWFTNYLNAGYA